MPRTAGILNVELDRCCHWSETGCTGACRRRLPVQDQPSPRHWMHRWFDLLSLVIFIAGVLAWLLAVSVVVVDYARADEPHSHDDAAGRFYENWMRPDEPGVSCCSYKDCYAAEFKREGGTWFARRREDAAWVPVPEVKFEHNRTDGPPRESPDGRNHVCMMAPSDDTTVRVVKVYCAVLVDGT